MLFMFVTEDTSQSPIGWLNAAASRNMVPMLVTEDTSQPPIGWLNAAAFSNKSPMSVTEDTSQPPIGWLNAAAPENMKCMLVTEDTSHASMPHRAPVGSASRHASTSAFSAVLSAKTLPPRRHSYTEISCTVPPNASPVPSWYPYPTEMCPST